MQGVHVSELGSLRERQAPTGGSRTDTPRICIGQQHQRIHDLFSIDMMSPKVDSVSSLRLKSSRSFSSGHYSALRRVRTQGLEKLLAPLAVAEHTN